MRNIAEIKQDEKMQRSVLITLKLLKKVMVVFSSIFLNVYIFQVLDNDFSMYLIGLISAIVFNQIFSLVIFSVLSQKNAMLIYRASFVFDIFLIILVIFIKSPTLPIILMFYALQELSNNCFYGPHEIGEMKATGHKNSSKYLVISTIFTSIVGIVSPFLSGLIIDKMSYTILFIIVGFIALVMFVVSIFMKDFDIISRKLQLKQFCQKAFKKPHIKSFYLSFTFFRFSIGGTVYSILPVVLFMKTNSEFSLGTYSSIFALLTILSLTIFMFIKRKDIVTIVAVVFMCVASIVLSFVSTFAMFVVFNAIYYSFGKIYENEVFSTRFNVIKTKELENYKKEHHLVYDIFANIGYILGFLLIFLLYSVIPSADALTIIIGGLGLFMIISLVFLIRAQNLYAKEVAQEEFAESVMAENKQ